MIRIDGRASYRFQIDIDMTQEEWNRLSYAEQQYEISGAIEMDPTALDGGDDEYDVRDIYTH